VVAEYHQPGKPEFQRVPVYLPKGTWFDYESLEKFDSNGGITKNIDLFRRERVPDSEPKSTYYFMNPLFAKEGAIIPKMYVDRNTMNALGKRWGEKDRKDELIARVFSGPTASQFILYEDDGVSRGYLKKQVRETVIWQKGEENKATVIVGGSKGSYFEAPSERTSTIELVVNNKTVKGVTLDGNGLTRCSPQQIKSFESDSVVCWYQPKSRLVKVRTASLPVDKTKKIEFAFE
jgi:alpha-glucosidase